MFASGRISPIHCVATGASQHRARCAQWPRCGSRLGQFRIVNRQRIRREDWRLATVLAHWRPTPVTGAKRFSQPA